MSETTTKMDPLEQLIVKRIANLQQKIDQIGEEKSTCIANVEKVICDITEDEERLNELLDEKVKCLISSVKMEEAKSRYTLLVSVDKIDTALENLDEIQNDEDKHNLLKEVMDDISGVYVPTFVEYAEKNADESDIQQLFGNVICRYKEQRNLHRYGCPFCLSVFISGEQPGELTTIHKFKCECCRNDIESTEKPKECKRLNYEFICKPCNWKTILRTMPRTQIISTYLGTEDRMITIRERQEKQYSCQCRRCMSVIIKSVSVEDPIQLETVYRYYCQHCLKTITTNEEPLIKEHCLIKTSKIPCPTCRGLIECKYLGEAQ